MRVPPRKSAAPISTDDQKSRLEALDTPIFLNQEARKKLPRVEHAVRLLRRVREVTRPQNLFQTSFGLFRTRLAFTKDESAGGIVRRMPDWSLSREIDDHLITWPQPMLVEKSRRVLLSWHVCCFDIWLAAGGMDPRWVWHEKDGDGRVVKVRRPLMESQRNRQVVVAAQRIEGVYGSDWYLRERIQFVLQQFEERGFREYWPDFPEWEYTFGKIEFSNGSRINAVPQGPNQSRGGGILFYHAEEFSTWELAGPTIGAAIPTLRPAGHCWCICTPIAGSFASRIVRGDVGNERRARR